MSNATLIAELVNKLLASTKSGKVDWQQKIGGMGYTARSGGFIVNLNKNIMMPTLSATRLSGSPVFDTANSLLSTDSGMILDVTTQSNISALWTLVADRSEDIRELIDSLK